MMFFRHSSCETSWPRARSVCRPSCGTHAVADRRAGRSADRSPTASVEGRSGHERVAALVRGGFRGPSRGCCLWRTRPRLSVSYSPSAFILTGRATIGTQSSARPRFCTGHIRTRGLGQLMSRSWCAFPRLALEGNAQGGFHALLPGGSVRPVALVVEWNLTVVKSVRPGPKLEGKGLLPA